jgi:hypothetical protein
MLLSAIDILPLKQTFWGNVRNSCFCCRPSCTRAKTKTQKCAGCCSHTKSCAGEYIDRSQYKGWHGKEGRSTKMTFFTTPLTHHIGELKSILNGFVQMRHLCSSRKIVSIFCPPTVKSELNSLQSRVFISTLKFSKIFVRPPPAPTQIKFVDIYSYRNWGLIIFI